MSKEAYTVDYFLEEDELNIDKIISDIEDLGSPPSIIDKKDPDPVDDTPSLFLSASKKKKKKKKKKYDDLLVDDEDDGHLSLTEINMQRLADKEDYTSGKDIIQAEKKNYNKYKKDGNEYKKEFAEELTLLYGLLDETKKFGNMLEKKWKYLEEQKSRGISKYTTDLAATNLDSKKTQLAIVSKITDVKKTIADLKIKADKEVAKTKETEDLNNDSLATKYFSQIINNGRGNFIDRLTAPTEYGVNNFDVRSYRETASSLFNTNGDDSSNDDIDFEDIIRQRQSEGGFAPPRSALSDKYIEYESRGVKIWINRCIDTNEWDFIAIDRHGERIDDYPLPNKRDVGKIRFSDDGSYATDSRGIMYDVKEYFSNVPTHGEEEYDDDDDEDGDTSYGYGSYDPDDDY